MATWEKPPTDAYDGLKAYMDATYPNTGYSMSCDANRKLIQLDMPDLSDADLANLIVALRTSFPGAF